MPKNKYNIITINLQNYNTNKIKEVKLVIYKFYFISYKVQE